MSPTNSDMTDEISYWVNLAVQRIEKKENKISTGDKTQNNLIGIADWHMSLALSRFLRGDEITEVRKSARQSTESIEISFRMAYDNSHPDYLGDRADLAEVLMTQAIDGFHAALIAGVFKIGSLLAIWAQIPADEIDEAGNPKHSQSLVANYMHALKFIFLGDDAKALKYTRATEKWFEKKGIPTKNIFHRNFFHRCRMVRAILENNTALFHASLQVQLKSHSWAAVHEDIADTPEAYIYVDGVALCNLAIHKGLDINVEADTIPKGLLIGK